MDIYDNIKSDITLLTIYLFCFLQKRHERLLLGGYRRYYKTSLLLVLLYQFHGLKMYMFIVQLNFTSESPSSSVTLFHFIPSRLVVMLYLLMYWAWPDLPKVKTPVTICWRSKLICSQLSLNTTGRHPLIPLMGRDDEGDVYPDDAVIWLS